MKLISHSLWFDKSNFWPACVRTACVLLEYGIIGIFMSFRMQTISFEASVQSSKRLGWCWFDFWEFFNSIWIFIRLHCFSSFLHSNQLWIGFNVMQFWKVSAMNVWSLEINQNYCIVCLCGLCVGTLVIVFVKFWQFSTFILIKP